MSDRAVHFHRVFRCPPAHLYRAFLQADALAKWLPPHGYTCTVQHFDPQVGGTFRMTFHEFTSGHAHSFGGQYLELITNQLIRYVDRFDDPGLPGEMQVRVDMKEVSVGTEVRISQSGIPEAIPLEMCHLGWQASLAQLALLVESGAP